MARRQGADNGENVNSRTVSGCTGLWRYISWTTHPLPPSPPPQPSPNTCLSAALFEAVLYYMAPGEFMSFITSWLSPLSDLFTYWPKQTSVVLCVCTVSLVMRVGLEHAKHAMNRERKRGREKTEEGGGQTPLIASHSLQVQSIGSMLLYCNHKMGNQIALSRFPLTPLSLSLPRSADENSNTIWFSPWNSRVCSHAKCAFMNRGRLRNCL